MGYFDNREHVDQYIEMAKGYDGRDLTEILKKHLPIGATVLELGMGPGKDLDILAEWYAVTGSDSSAVFLDLYRSTHAEADLLVLDAESIETDRLFDCIYSNKVLHHLTKLDLERSFKRQKKVITDGGLLMHSFWLGRGEEDYDGLRFIYYTEEEILSIAGPSFKAVEINRYTEIEDNDSFYVLLQK